jgi:TRAP-type C4-dicarboxylate transport system permease small subunit
LSTTSNLFARGERSLTTVELAALRINIFIIFAMMLTVVYGVIMRYIFNVPVRWVAELSEFMMVALTFLALAYVQRQRKHIIIKIFIERRSNMTKVVLGVVTDLAAFFIFVLLTWASWKFALQAWRSGFTSDAADIPLFPPRLLVPIGAGLMCLQLLADVVQGIGLLLGIKATEGS